MVPDDVLVFVYTHAPREAYQVDARRSWGAYAKNFLTFSDREYSATWAHVARKVRPDWTDHPGQPDGLGAAFAPFVLQHLYDVGRARGIKYFLNFDDDSVPLWPAIMGLLREYQDAHGGMYPYSASGFEADLTHPQRLLYLTEASGSQMRKGRLVFDGGMGAPSGQVYGFNLSALHDYMIAIETCPVTFQGDGEQGAIMACAGRALEEGRGIDTPEARQAGIVGSVGEFFDNMEWDAAVWSDAAMTTLNILYGLTKEGEKTAWQQRLCTWHKVKLQSELRLVYDAYFATFFGSPKLADLPPDAHEPPCTYAPPGEHLFTWESR
jgi:hypothetical protein